MTESPGAKSAGGQARAQLREQQLLLMHATDQRILDHNNRLADTLQFIVNETRNILSADHVDVVFLHGDGFRLEISSDPDAEIGRFVPLEGSISGLVLERGEPVAVSDLQSDPELRERYFPRVGPRGTAPRLSFLADVFKLEGRDIGVINVEAPPGVEWDDSHHEFVNVVARQMSMAITHAALFDEDTFRTETDRLLMESTSADSVAIMRRVLEEIRRALGQLTFLQADAADILFDDPQDPHCLVVAYSTNSDDIGVRVDIGTSVCGEAYRRRETVLEQRALAERSDYRPVTQGMRCEMAIPIIFGGTGSSRFPLGVLNLESSRENAFSIVGQELAERFTRRIVNHVAMIKIRADAESTMQDQFMTLAADQVLNSVHRINNCVGAIRAQANDLLYDLETAVPPDPDELAQALRKIVTDAEEALAIPEELRKRIVTPQESDDVNAQVLAGIAAVKIPPYIELCTDLAPDLPRIRCTALDLVVENLLLNAVKAMHGRPGPLRVTTRLDPRLPREPFIVVSVQDSGVGMTKEQYDRLFEPRRAGHQGGGLGFGMMWVRNWVRRAQGLINVESTPGEGTTAYIRFQVEEHRRVPQEGERA